MVRWSAALVKRNTLRLNSGLVARRLDELKHDELGCLMMSYSQFIG